MKGGKKRAHDLPLEPMQGRDRAQLAEEGRLGLHCTLVMSAGAAAGSGEEVGSQAAWSRFPSASRELCASTYLLPASLSISARCA